MTQTAISVRIKNITAGIGFNRSKEHSSFKWFSKEN